MFIDCARQALRRGSSWASVLLLSASALAQTPSLHHSAPFVGSDLEMRVAGAPAGAIVALYQSERRGSTTTPYGTWELNRAAMRRVAIGLADMNGEFSYVWSVPLAAELVERPMHYQALVRAPGMTVVSEAVHLRLLGARAYVMSDGDPDALVPEPASLTIASLTNAETVATVDLGFIAPGSGGWSNDHPAHPVFDSVVSRAAVTTSNNEITFFDPFEGTVLARTALPQISRRLLVDPDGNKVFALERGDLAANVPAVVHVLDMRTGAPLSSLQLPAYRFSGQWISNLDRTFAYAVGFDEMNARLFAMRIELVVPGVTEMVEIAAPKFDRIVSMTATQQSVFMHARRDVQWCQREGVLTRIDEALGAPVTSITPWGNDVHMIVAAPLVGVFASLGGHACMPLPSLTLARLASPTGFTRSVFGLWADAAGMVRPLESGLWVDTFTNDWNGEEIARFDTAQKTWRTWSLGLNQPPIPAIDAVDDPFGERGCAIVMQYGQLGVDPWYEEAQLYIVDPLTTNVVGLPVASWPHALLAVPIP